MRYSDYSLSTKFTELVTCLWWFVQNVHHGLARQQESILIVSDGVLLSISFPHKFVVACLIEVRLLVEHKSLKG
jgi:hypothetical protein